MAWAHIFVVDETRPNGELIQESHPSDGHSIDTLVILDVAEDLGIPIDSIVRAFVTDNDGSGLEDT
ncbi:MAG TPA: hypothetical protein VK211_24305 [Kamptonema sp.]|nr:hypothetical protein [Kamptonema sp.]